MLIHPYTLNVQHGLSHALPSFNYKMEIKFTGGITELHTNPIPMHQGYHSLDELRDRSRGLSTLAMILSPSGFNFIVMLVMTLLKPTLSGIKKADFFRVRFLV